MKKEKIKINIKGKNCTIRFNPNKVRFEHNFGYKDNNGIRQSRIITGASIEELTKNIESFQDSITQHSINSSNIIFKNYIKYYFDNVAIFKNRKSTIINMQSSLRALPDTILNTPLKDLTTNQFQVVYANLNQSHTVNTVNYLNQCVNVVLNNAVKTKIISKNVNKECVVHNYVNGKKVYISIDNIISILDKLKNHKRYYVLYKPILFLSVSGVRLGECLGLKKECIDIKTGIVKIQSQISALLGYSENLKTKSSYRSIQLDMNIINILTQYDNDSDFVFTSPRGNMWSVRSFRDIFNKAFKELGYPDITPKQFRNSFVKNAVKDNTSLKIIQNILGHSKLSTTMDIYGELSDSDTYNATKSMCSHFSSV